MENYLKDPRCEISNNRAENKIRPFTVGRKNWLFSDTPAGARASAVIYSIVETAKANNLAPRDYIQYLFENLPDMEIQTHPERLDQILPCMQENTTKIRNIKQYLKAVLFNAPSTIDSYYTSLVAHDMASGALAPRKPKYGDLDYYTYNEGESL